MNIEQLRAKMQELGTASASLAARLENGEELTESELDMMDVNMSEMERIEAAISRLDRHQAWLDKSTAGAGHKTVTAAAPGTPGNPAKAPSIPRGVNGSAGFKSFGEFGQSVLKAAMSPSNVDGRLLASQGNNITTGADGGFLVPPDFRQMIMEKVLAPESLLGRTDGLQTVANTVTIPKDPYPTWDGTNGVQGYWTAEGVAITPSKGKFLQSTISLNKLACLVPVTEEQMEDGPLIDSYLRRKVPQKLDFMISDAILNGNGSGKPMGILDAGATGTVSVATTTTAAEVILYEDVLAMWGHLYAPWRSNSVWLVHPAVEEKLNALAFDSGATSKVPAYMPANGLSASPYGTLMGRPVIPHQCCAAVSDPGDIILGDFSQYLSLTKTTGIRTDVSMHVYFATDEQAFRFIIRVGGEPWWDEVIAAKNGTYNQSAFVKLADRI